MTAILSNNARGGVAGQSVTQYNSGEVSGDSWRYMFLSATATITYAQAPVRSDIVHKFSSGSTAGQAYLTWGILPDAPVYYVRFYVYPEGLPSVSVRFCELWVDESTFGFTLGMRASGQLALKDSQGATVGDSTIRLRPSQWARIELKIVASPTNGQVETRIYTEADSPYYAERMVSAATFNTLPLANSSSFRFGLPTLPSANYTAYLNCMSISDTDWLGPADWGVDAPLVIRNDAETGTPGATVAPNNSGDAQNRFIDGVANAVGASTYSTAQAAHGSQSFYFQPVDGDAHFYVYRLLGTNRAAARMYLYLTALPAVGAEVMQFTTPDLGGFAALSRVIISSTAQISLWDSAGTVLWTSAAPMPLNTWIRFEMFAQIGATAGTGEVRFAYYNHDSTTPVQSFSTSTANLGTLTIGGARFGKVNNNSWTAPFYLDGLSIQQAASGFIGPWATPPTPPASFAGIVPHLGWGRQV